MTFLVQITKNKKIAIHCIFMLLVIGTTFLTSKSFVQEYMLPKVYCFIICSFVLFLSFLFFNKESFKIDKLTVFIFLFVGYLLLHSFFYPIRYLNWIILLSFLCLYIFFKQNNNIDSKFINVNIVIICLIQALYGLAQYAGLVYKSSSFPITGSFDNPAGFAVCLAIGFPFAFELFKENIYLKFLSISSAIIIATTIALSESRTGIVCILFVSVIYVYHKFIKKKIKLKKLLLGLSIIFSIALFACLIYIKKDSASGRLLIWEVTTDMIKDNPILGSGGDSFEAKYMLSQDKYFEQYPDSKYTILADNVIHPFNEYLLLTVEYGYIALLLLICCIIIIIRSKIDILSPYFLSLLSIAIFSCFSYPFKYPFVCLLLALCLVQLSKKSKIIFSFNFHKLVIVGLTGTIITCLIILSKDIQFEYKWKKIVRLSSLGETSSLITDYENLFDCWNRNPLFLYNYGAELNRIKNYSASINVLHKCEKYFNDYDVQMLLADNYYKLNCFDEAEKHYQIASNMCPNRFLPLYWMMKIYDKKEQSKEAKKIAEIIIYKEVKIPSATITQILTEAKNRIDSEINTMKNTP